MNLARRREHARGQVRVAHEAELVDFAEQDFIFGVVDVLQEKLLFGRIRGEP